MFDLHKAQSLWGSPYWQNGCPSKAGSQPQFTWYQFTLAEDRDLWFFYMMGVLWSLCLNYCQQCSSHQSGYVHEVIYCKVSHLIFAVQVKWLVRRHRQIKQISGVSTAYTNDQEDIKSYDIQFWSSLLTTIIILHILWNRSMTLASGSFWLPLPMLFWKASQYHMF